MKKIFLSILIFVPFFSHSASIYCSGKIENSYIDGSGNVTIKGTWRKNWTRICNTSDSDVVNCSLWASYVATAVKDNLSVIVSYSANNGETCSSLPTYNSAPKPVYLMIKNPTFG